MSLLLSISVFFAYLEDACLIEMILCWIKPWTRLSGLLFSKKLITQDHLKT